MLLLVVKGNTYSGSSIKEPSAQYKHGQISDKRSSQEKATPGYRTVKPEENERK